MSKRSRGSVFFCACGSDNDPLSLLEEWAAEDAFRFALLWLPKLVEKALNQLHWQSHNVGGAAGQQERHHREHYERQAVDVPVEEAFLERPHFELTLIGGAQRGVFGILPEADAGDDSMFAAAEGYEHAPCFGRAGGLAEFPAVDFAERVAGENESPIAAFCHRLGFCPGEPEDVGFERFVGAPAWGGHLSLVGRRDDFDLPASLGGELPSARRSAGKNDPRARW